MEKNEYIILYGPFAMGVKWDMYKLYLQNAY
jgi:hypothetical protein